MRTWRNVVMGRWHISLCARGPPRRPLAILFLSPSERHQPLAFVQPSLDANLTVGRIGLRETVIDVGAKHLERQLPVQIPLRACDFGAVQSPRHTNLDAAGAKPQGGLYGFTHGTPERDPLLELHGHGLGNELGVQFRLLDFLNINEHLAAGPFLDFLLQLVDFRPLTADDDAGTRRVNVDFQLIGRAFGLNLRDPRVREPLFEHLPQCQVLVQQLRVVAIRVPARPPRLVESKPESKRVNLLAHECSFLYTEGTEPSVLPGAFGPRSFLSLTFLVRLPGVETA